MRAAVVWHLLAPGFAATLHLRGPDICVRTPGGGHSGAAPPACVASGIASQAQGLAAAVLGSM